MSHIFNQQRHLPNPGTERHILTALLHPEPMSLCLIRITNLIISFNVVWFWCIISKTALYLDLTPRGTLSMESQFLIEALFKWSC